MSLFSGNSTVNTTITATGATVGSNSTVTSFVANATGIYANGTMVANSTGPYGKTEATLNVNSSLSSNNSSYLGGTAAASYQLNSTLNANIASYLPTYTGTVNGAIIQTGGGGGSATGGVSTNATTVTIGNSTVNTTINSTTFSGTANNASYLGGTAAASYQLNSTLNANIASYLPTYTGTVNAALLQTGGGGGSATGGISTNATTILIGNSTVNVSTNSTHFYAGNTTYYGYGNSTADVLVNPTGQVTILPTQITISANATSNIVVGNSTVNTTINSTTFSGTANNASYLGGTAAASYQLNSTLNANIASYLPTYTGVVNGSSHTVGTSLIANATGVYHTGTVNAASLTVGTSTIANTTGVYTGVVNGSSITVGTSTISNSTGVYTGVVNGSSITVGTSTISNSTGVYTGVVNGSSITVGTAFTANATVVNAVSFYAGATLIGNTTGPYGKTEGNLNVNSSLTSNNSSYLGGTAAASYQLNSTLNANIASYLPTYTGVVNGSSITVGTSTISNSTGVYTGVVNGSSITVGTSTISNSTGVYTGVVNAATHSVGTAFTANATVVNAVSYYAGATLIGNTTGPYGKTEGNLNVNSALIANTLLRIDARNIVANDTPAGYLRFGFTSFAVNNTSPYGDFLQLRSYTDSSGGSDNLVVFNKSTIGVRVYQAAWTNSTTGNTSAWSTYKDLAFTDGTNATGTWNITANNASYLGGTAAASYQLNSTLNANVASYLPTYTGVVNGSSHTVGTSLIANATGVYHTGTVNAASLTVGASTIANATGVYTGIINAATHSVGTAFTANATVVNAVSYYAGATLIGNTTGPYGKTEATLNVNSSLTSNNSSYLGGTAAASYALLASPTFTGTVTAANTTITDVLKSTKGLTETSGYRIVNPGGGTSITSTASVTGAIKIKLPVAVNDSNTMMRLTIKIFEYAGGNVGTSRTIEIGGYNYAPGIFGNQIFATQSTMGGGDINVRFGSDGTGNCIWIGELATVWAYPQVFITEVQCGYSGYSETNWTSGWVISFATTFDTVEAGPIIAAKPVTSQNYNSYAPTLTGTGASGTWNITANNSSYLGGTAAASYALLSGAAFTGAVSSTTFTTNGTLTQAGGFGYLGSFNTQTYPTFGSTGTVFSWNFSGGQAENNIWNAINPTTYANTGFRFMQQLSASTYRDLMYIRQDGNVGIGTTAPAVKLQVAGNMGVDAFVECSANIATSYTITTGKNAMTAGPVGINSGVTITVPSGSTWTIV